MDQRNSGHVRWSGVRNHRRGNDRRNTRYGGEISSRGGYSRNSGDPVVGDGDGGGCKKNMNFYGKSIVYHSRQIDLEPGMKGILAVLVTNKNNKYNNNEGIEEICEVVDQYSYSPMEIGFGKFCIIEDEKFDKATTTTEGQCGKSRDKENAECLSSVPLTMTKDTASGQHSETDNPWIWSLYNEPKTPENRENKAKSQEDEPDKENASGDSVCDNYPSHTYVAFATCARNVIFINSKKGNPKELVEKVYEGVISSEGTKFKHLHRFIPVDVTVTSNCDDIISKSRSILLDYFTDKGYISFDIEIHSHFCYGLLKRFNRQDEFDIVQLLQNTVTTINPRAFVSFYQPAYLISVQIFGSVACLSVLTNCGKYNRYILKEF